MKAVLLLHGFVTDKRDFDPLYEKLEGMYDCVDAMTLPGHGERGNYKDFTVKNTMDAVLNEFDKLKDTYEIIDVIGFSMGGALATWLSNKRSFRRLVLLAPANKYLHPTVIFNVLNYFVKCKKEEKKLKNNNLEYLNMTQNIRNVHLNSKKSMDMAIKQLFPNYTIRNVYTFTNIINECNHGTKEIKNETLIIWGKMDQLVPKKSVLHDYEICTNPKKKLVIFDEYSHLMLHSVNPGKIVNEVISFLK